jgi:hypothetical protein
MRGVLPKTVKWDFRQLNSFGLRFMADDSLVQAIDVPKTGWQKQSELGRSLALERL